MKRDIKLIAKILTNIESNETIILPFEQTKISSGKYTEDEIVCALDLIREMKFARFVKTTLIDSRIPNNFSGYAVKWLRSIDDTDGPRGEVITFPHSLTWKGHDFLDSLRKEKTE